jgi:hypothetical protein
MLRRTSLLLVLVGALACSFAAPALAGTEDDEAIAEDAVLTEDDVADYGFEEIESDEDDSPPSGSACKKVRAAVKVGNRAPHATTSFGNAEAAVGDRVIVFKNAKAAKAQFATYASSQSARCLRSSLEEGIEGSFDVADLTIPTFEGDSVGLGDDSVVYQVPISITETDGTTQELYVELGVIRVGRAVVILTVQAGGEPFAGSEELATILTDRLTESV